MLQTTLCYLEKDGCYLMLHRIKKKKDVNHDKWVGVGGKFEPGEDALACVLRETREETGFTLQNPAYRGIVDFYAPPWPSERMHLFTCTDFCGEPIDCIRHSEHSSASSTSAMRYSPPAAPAVSTISCTMRSPMDSA